jgi:hypothetical protein
MRIKLFFLLIAVLLLATGTIFGDGNPNEPCLAVRSDVTGPQALPVPGEDLNITEVAFTGNHTIELKNPSFQELKDFILRDTTSRNRFVLNTYECRHFATEVDNSAEAAGLRCGFVLLCFERGQHAVVAFETTDRGVIYIEPQTDAAIEVAVGGMYQGRQIKEILIAW